MRDVGTVLKSELLVDSTGLGVAGGASGGGLATDGTSGRMGNMSGLHPQVRKALDDYERTVSDMGLTDFHSGGVDKARELMQALAAPRESLPEIHSVQDRTVPGPEGEIPIRIIRPSDDTNLPLLLWFHGGGWVVGDLDSSELSSRRLANEVGCVVVSVGYRLAPEAPFPAAIDDCTAAVEWAIASAGELGIDSSRIAVGGDSAGGNLAACAALRMARKGQTLAFQLLVYPVTDADFDRPSYLENGQGYLLTREAMRWFWDCYVPDQGDRWDPDACPIRAKDLSWLPPAMVITAEYDPLRDEGEAYGAALESAGVPVQVQRYEGVNHGFFHMITEEPVEEITRASEEAAVALRRALGLGL